jgi:hypothetical protein
MKAFQLISMMKKLVFVLVAQLMITVTMAQVKYHAKDDLNLVISGTSTLHDWTMKTAKGECDAIFVTNAGGQLTGLTSLSFITPAESLKSEHSGMDKNAYKALKTDKAATITFTQTSSIVTADGTVKSIGRLTIAGATIITDIVAVTKVNADKSISVKGSKKISMKDFKIDPPTFMMGTIKTGNDIVLKFDLTLRK